MKCFEWNEIKNSQLLAERGVGFEQVVIAIEENRILDVLDHPNREKYAGQQIMVIDIEGYAFLVPFVETEKTLFLKTIIPSRKASRIYLEINR